MLKIKKGAMFGLDARIALAIFGALSVISGAALYSAIQQSKVTQLVTSLQELAKATEAYYLDTGDWLPIDKTYPVNNRLTTSKYLVEEPTGVTGWKGPYISYPAFDYALKHNIYNNAHIQIAQDDYSECDKTNACFLWSVVNGVPPEIATAVDVEIDGEDDSAAGKFRHTAYTGVPGTREVYLKIDAIPGK